MFDRLKRFWLMQSVRPRARVVGHVDVSQWRRQTLEDEEFEGVEFAGDAWDQWMAIGCRFVDCTFGGLRVRNGEPAFGGGSRQSQYVRCNFDGANLRHFAPGLARFEQCSFHRVIISDCHSFNAEFVECAFSGRIRDTVFWGHDWAFQVSRQNEFVRNDFSQCVLDGVSFRGGISVREQRLPEADKYLYVADLAAALNHIRRRRPDPRSTCAPVIRRPRSANVSARIPGTSSSRRPSRCTCCSPGGRETDCAPWTR